MISVKYQIPKITVLGIGGAGCNVINHIIDCEIENVDFIAANTDSQALLNSRADQKIYLGQKSLKGLGAGSNMDVGRKAAEESKIEIKKSLEGTDLLFLICGLGGGTGTGATPVIADIAKEMNILVVSLVMKPFTFEGGLRTANAMKGIQEIRIKTDSLIIYSNDKLLEELGEVPLQQAFESANENCKRVIEAFVDIIISPSNVNLDFSDIKKLLTNAKNTFFGFGIAEGEGKAITAAKSAIDCKFLEASIKGAKKAIIFIVSGKTTSLLDIRRAINYIQKISGTNINLQFGQKTNKELNDKMLISLIAVDFDESEIKYANLENIERKSKIKEIEKNISSFGIKISDSDNSSETFKEKNKFDGIDEEDDDIPSFMK